MSDQVSEQDTSSLRELDELIGSSSLMITQEEIDEARRWLLSFYSDINYEGNIPDKVEEVINKSIKGWERAPKSFFKRVKKIVGHHAIYKLKQQKKDQLKKGKFTNESLDGALKGFENETNDENQEEISQDISDENVVEKSDVVFGESIFDYLYDDEKKFWIKREAAYRKEFDFNNSSDRVLLEEVIYIEILLRRLRLSVIDQTREYNVKGLREQDLMDSHKKALEKLGILRVQRIQFDQNIEGNVSELTLLLDEKLNEIKQLKDNKLYKKSIDRIKDKFNILTITELVDLAEEAALLKEVERMTPINIVPQAVYNSILTALEDKTELPTITDDTVLNEITEKEFVL